MNDIIFTVLSQSTISKSRLKNFNFLIEQGVARFRILPNQTHVGNWSLITIRSHQSFVATSRFEVVSLRATSECFTTRVKDGFRTTRNNLNLSSMYILYHTNIMALSIEISLKMGRKNDLSNLVNVSIRWSFLWVVINIRSNLLKAW